MGFCLKLIICANFAENLNDFLQFFEKGGGEGLVSYMLDECKVVDGQDNWRRYVDTGLVSEGLG